MALTLKVQQVVKEPDGIYSVYAEAVEDITGKVVDRKCVQGSTKEEIKDALRPSWEALKTSHANKQIILALAEEALAELEAE